MKIHILVNANAKAVRSERIPTNYLQKFLSERISMRVTQSVDEIDEAVIECWEEGADVVILATGDGGLHRFMSGFISTYQNRASQDGSKKPLPLFATFRSGTANLITGILGVKGEPLQAVRELFDRLQSAKDAAELPRIRQKLLSVSDGIQERFGFVAGNGAIYNFFEEYYQGSRYSIRKFLKILTKAVLSLFTGTGYINRLFAGMEARLALDEKKQRIRQWKMMVVSAIDTKVVFFRAFRIGNLTDRIHIKAGNPSRWAIIRNIPNLLFNRRLKGKQLLDKLATKVTFERDREFGYTIDGELYNARQISMGVGPEVEFVQL
jgi:diacylglycerol kinase family enzyme